MIRLKYKYMDEGFSYIERYDMENHSYLNDDMIGAVIYTEEDFSTYLTENYGADWRDTYIISESTEYY